MRENNKKFDVIEPKINRLLELCLEEFLNSDSLPTAKTLSKEINLDGQNCAEEEQTEDEEDIETIVAQEVL